MTKMCAILQLVSALLNPSTSLNPSTNPSCNSMTNIFDEQLKAVSPNEVRLCVVEKVMPYRSRTTHQPQRLNVEQYSLVTFPQNEVIA